MKLTQQHIDELYQFTRKHYVEWYDLQTELVDHLANDIEAIWQENPNLSFFEARNRAFKKFGVFGFSSIIDKRRNALSKRYTKIMVGFVKEWLGLPKVLALITTTYFFHLLFSLEHGRYLYYGIMFLLLVYVFIKVRKLNREFKDMQKTSGKKWLFQEIIFKTSVSNVLLIFISIFNVYNFSNIFHDWTSWAVSVFIVLTLLVCYITLEIIPKRSEKILKATYPDFNYQ